MLPCIAAVAIATFVGAKTLDSNAYSAKNLLVQNIEALSEDEECDNTYIVRICYMSSASNGDAQGIICNPETKPMALKDCPRSSKVDKISQQGHCIEVKH